ncbi:pre-mRNA-splicing factor syf2 [Mayamaea pseudoterrestris]|nr:pre-mRNA-splicing factor syf2 [Mayamaea pseudoterrestris]
MDASNNEAFDEDDSEIPLNDDAKVGGEPPHEESGANLTEAPPAKELTPHQLRMQKLLLKMNQARQLNRQAVQEEGSTHARSNNSSGQGKKDKANPVTSLQAADAIQRAERRADRQEAARHSMHDYHNPEAQHRQYQRSLKSVHPSSATSNRATDASTFDPLMTMRNKEDERQGAHRLAQEMQRRNEKKRKNEANKKDKEEDVAGHINKRNKEFNKKLDRNFQDHVKEIQQNLERGTAL